jgi:hypothetical protein
MESKKINQLATNVAPVSTDLTIIGDPITGVSKKVTLLQIASLFGGIVSFYTNLAAFPATGSIDTIYCAKDTQKLYLWSGSAYVQTFPSQALLDTYQLLSAKGVANGYASLDSGGKVPIAQLPSSIMEYKGMWNASTNTPTLANGTGDTGDVYICNVAGSVNFGAGVIVFAIGDYVIYSGSIWQRSSGAVGTVTSVGLSSATSGVTIGSSPITTSGTITLAIANATTSQNGLLTSTDWATFNAKQNAITLTTTGTSGASTLVGATLNIPNYGSALTGYVPYTGATQDVDLGAFKLNAQSLHIKGTAGNGHLGLKHQSASATASANEVSLFADSLGDLSWLNGNLYLSKFITSSNTANRSYTFPNANGTIALTSQLSSYVPYTGATTSVNLGLYDLTALYLAVSQDGDSVGGYINFKQCSSVNNGSIGNTNIFAKNSTQFGINYMQSSGLNKTAIFDASSITTGNVRTFTFPDASGTLALTSSLSGYLPLTGGTLTGQLYINPTNTATVGLDVASDTIRFRSDNLEGYKRQLEITMGSGTLVQCVAKGFGGTYATDLAFYTSSASGVNGSPAMYITGGNNIGIGTGSPSYTLDVSGTGRFSSRINGVVGGTAYNTAGLWLQGSSATDGISIGGTAGGDKGIDTYGGTLRLNGTSGNGLFVSGAATFDNVITATAATIASNIASDPVYLRIRNTNTGGYPSSMALSVYGYAVAAAYYDPIRIQASYPGYGLSNIIVKYQPNSADVIAMSFRGDGLIFFGTATNSPYNYNVTYNPRAAGLGQSGDFGYIVSTRESKGNIQSLKTIDYLNQLNPVSFNYRKKNEDKTEFIDETYEDVYYGFIADEVEKVNKDIVFYDDLPDGTKKLAGVHYNSVIAILTKAVQDQQVQIQSLQEQINSWHLNKK